MKIALAQMRMMADIDVNYQKSVKLITEAAHKGADLMMAFSGESIVTDYDGETVALAGDDEELLIAEVDIKGAADRRAHRPYTGLRRTQFYE